MASTTFTDNQSVIYASWLNDVNTATYTTIPALSNTSGITYNFGTSSSVNRTLQNKLQESVSVKDFGATGDGTTDDTVAIQAALSALVQTGTGLYSSTPAKELFIPAGIYIFSSALTIPKNVKIKGEGKNSTILKSTHTGNGLTTINAVNSGTGINVQLEDLAIWNTNASNTGGGYVDVSGTYITLRNVQILGFKYNVIFDQSELADCELCDFENPLTACVWLVNGPDHTTGASYFYTNRISVRNSQFSSTVGSIGVIDDGGYAHSFVDNNYNGCTNHFRVAGVIGLKIAGGEFEGATSTNLIFTNTTYNSASSVGSSQSVYIGGGAVILATSTNNIFNASYLGTVTLDTLTLSSTGTKYVGTANTGGLFARNIYSLGAGVLFDGKAGSQIEDNVTSRYINIPTTITQFASPIQTITQVTGALNANTSSVMQINNNGGATYTVAAPIGGIAGQRISIKDINSSSGAGGAYTWNAIYKMAAWTRPAAGYSRSIDFIYNGTNWVEVSRTPADVPN